MIGRFVHVTAGLDRINIHHDGVLVSSHPRSWARQLSIIDPAHVIRAAELRAQHRSQHRETPALAAVETASLAHYDTLFSLTPDAASTLLNRAELHLRR
jgi:hypothetical protein